ncbi:citrate (pro-3S)-lyase subunit beta [Vibrio anguillarum]|nr:MULTISPECIES: citrate (pro-3S)-lyase subunit beta [Vibrio]AVT68237.1 citrate (pro-3S)-lyase subunit beta [Vibrio anguillarum]MBF4302118.1 citrate (pro-3S)-lyase subunit beta [Vibrio anguillarum]MBT2910409.1 citrate (pro-3S)-lyase subunit beta [Vibrio anguillarum]MBT2926683.1 citrate (pro-3S)-lyase subunit beta [Vibrio anguillarum]MBT2934317.1 citrate (pro-3S)-lyase subunit beta [Vibrio anguillarum]
MSKLRRSMLFVPSSNAAMLSNAFIYTPDAIMFDLEDSVSLREKDTARMLVYNALQHPLYQNIETIVRVNALESDFGHADVRAVVKAGVNAVRLPKTDTLQDVVDMELAIEQAEIEFGRKLGSTKMLAAIESAMGVNNAVEIACGSKRLIGIALGAEDYVRDLRTQRTSEGTELLFARCSILQAARAAGVMAFDTVYSDANNDEGFLHEAEQIKTLGFDGKSLINPRQIEMIHNVFAPSQKEVDHAYAVIEVAQDAEQQGSGVVSLNGKMVDAPIIERARWTLERAKSGIKQ